MGSLRAIRGWLQEKRFRTFVPQERNKDRAHGERGIWQGAWTWQIAHGRGKPVLGGRRDEAGTSEAAELEALMGSPRALWRRAYDDGRQLAVEQPVTQKFLWWFTFRSIMQRAGHVTAQIEVVPCWQLEWQGLLVERARDWRATPRAG
jgi:hypothetical protein